MLEVAGREERPTPPKAVARKSAVPAKCAARCAYVCCFLIELCLGGACESDQGRRQKLLCSTARQHPLGPDLNGLHGSIAGRAIAHPLGCLQLSVGQLFQDEMFYDFNGFSWLSFREPRVLAGSASGSSFYASDSDDGIICDMEEVPPGKLLGGKDAAQPVAEPVAESLCQALAGLNQDVHGNGSRVTGANVPQVDV